MDLDFFTGMDFQIESVISEIRKAGHSFQIISEGEGYLVGTIEGIKVSLFTYEYPFLEKTIVYEGIRVAGVLDIASMKVIAISQRERKGFCGSLLYSAGDTLSQDCRSYGEALWKREDKSSSCRKIACIFFRC